MQIGGIHTASYGKEKPVFTEHDTECQQQNRGGLPANSSWLATIKSGRFRKGGRYDF